MVRISQLKIKIEDVEKNEDQAIRKALLKKLQISKKEVFYTIVKKSIDARKKQSIQYIYTIDIENIKEEKRLIKKNSAFICVPKKNKYNFSVSKRMQREKLKTRPIIVGFGPAGLFCALMLAREGFCPLVLEQGEDVERRIKSVSHFWKTNQLNPNSNVVFGEGGAGTFSDGKLNTGVKDLTGKNKKILEIFVEHGAPSEILYWYKPHIGTDHLANVVKSIREEIIDLGGEVRFETKLTDIELEDQKISSVVVNQKERIPCQVLVLAIGHSARDTFFLLEQKNIAMERKAFAIGVRIEHSQQMIGQNQYGNYFTKLPAADYKLTYQAKTGRQLYSFCMCPGGFVVNSASEDKQVVVNGMSNYAREERNANSALVVSITPDDFPDNSVLSGITFQRKWESLAYQVGEGKIPVQLLGDFYKNKKSTSFGNILPNTKGGYQMANLNNCLPYYVIETLKEGILTFDKKIEGYAKEDVVLSGVETRTSSPVRISRDKQLESNKKGIYPCGEGAGYAGGITSAAIDGIKIFEAIACRYQYK